MEKQVGIPLCFTQRLLDNIRVVLKSIPFELMLQDKVKYRRSWSCRYYLCAYHHGTHSSLHTYKREVPRRPACRTQGSRLNLALPLLLKRSAIVDTIAKEGV